MLKSHERFHSANGKRLILVADDEFINREILRETLKDEYELIFAENGEQVLALMRENHDALSLVLLDLMMPVLSGTEVLREAKADPTISQIPIVVITSDQDAEVESLTLGAIDFIPKPYPRPGVILARIQRTIELFEDRQIINSTERDPLTGLYNREYFYRYAEQYDQHHKAVDMDAIVVDINHFHMINDRFGTAYGDSVLRHIGEVLRETVADIGGIVCRREADTFLVYCPHGKDYEAILDQASAGLSESSGADSARIWLRMGVYANTDKNLEIERRFDRAKMAADTVQGSFTKRIGVYDHSLREHELYSEQLVGDFPKAIKEHQFQIHYQPKFDIQPDIPVLHSAEALVRWNHPELGMISPGIFIPLFEDNGLIQQLDMYVWREAATQIKEWKTRFNFVVPVSVNVSRIDMYDPHLVEDLLAIIEENGLTTNELLLEITESAYAQDSEQIIETVNDLRALGFKVEMDDFGTGYSSLNMISTLPIDALKLDMLFIRNAFGERADTRMLEIVIDIANYLSVPTIAEGVETEEQMIALREMGCDFVQGYYFSRPLPAHEYEEFVATRKEQMGSSPAELESSRKKKPSPHSTSGDITHALSSGFEVIYYIDTKTNHYIEFSSEGARENLHIEGSGADFFGNMMQLIFEPLWFEDRARVEISMQKEALLSQLAGNIPLFMTYRKISADGPVFYSLKAVKATTHDDHHIVVGISNVDSQIKQVEIEPHTNEINFGSLAQALSSDMESIYYVDVTTEEYLEFKTDGRYRSLGLQQSGSNFFDECTRNILDVVYRDDQERVAAAMDKSELLGALDEHGVFSLAYRLVINGMPMFYSLKTVWAGDGKRHIIIGVSNVDSQVTKDEKLEAQRQSSVTYASIVKALAADYFSIYYVNIDSGSFFEYSSHEQFAKLGIAKSGDDFFTENRNSITKFLHPDDVQMYLDSFTRENVLASLDRDKTFTLTYRLMFDGEPTYFHLKATRMDEQQNSYIVIGVSNVDEQIRREQEYARALRMATRDALTGVKSKYAYDEDERKIDDAIASGEQTPFAVAVCDVNGLKATNDQLGHGAGDQLLKDACSIVCNVFKHSPVYRIGGDEFVAILRGNDYEDRVQLMERLSASNDANKATNGVLIAGGMSTYEPNEDEAISAVFKRADAAMYEDKRRLKVS